MLAAAVGVRLELGGGVSGRLPRETGRAGRAALAVRAMAAGTGLHARRLRLRHRRKKKHQCRGERFHVTSGPGDFRYCLTMASAAQYDRAPTVPVGLYDGFCGKFEAPMTNTLCASQLCRKRLTTLVLRSSPITVPPVLWVDWYCVTV